MINWKVRLKNKTFWITLVPVLVLLLKAIANLLGLEIEIASIEGWLLELIEAVFILLGVIGIVTDPTTAGLNDSSQALTYDKPKDY